MKGIKTEKRLQNKTKLEKELIKLQNKIENTLKMIDKNKELGSYNDEDFLDNINFIKEELDNIIKVSKSFRGHKSNIVETQNFTIKSIDSLKELIQIGKEMKQCYKQINYLIKPYHSNCFYKVYKKGKENIYAIYYNNPKNNTYELLLRKNKSLPILEFCEITYPFTKIQTAFIPLYQEREEVFSLYQEIPMNKWGRYVKLSEEDNLKFKNIKFAKESIILIEPLTIMIENKTFQIGGLKTDKSINTYNEINEYVSELENLEILNKLNQFKNSVGLFKFRDLIKDVKFDIVNCRYEAIIDLVKYKEKFPEVNILRRYDTKEITVFVDYYRCSKIDIAIQDYINYYYI